MYIFYVQPELAGSSFFPFPANEALVFSCERKTYSVLIKSDDSRRRKQLALRNTFLSGGTPGTSEPLDPRHICIQTELSVVWSNHWSRWYVQWIGLSRRGIGQLLIFPTANAKKMYVSCPGKFRFFNRTHFRRMPGLVKALVHEDYNVAMDQRFQNCCNILPVFTYGSIK